MLYKLPLVVNSTGEEILEKAKEKGSTLQNSLNKHRKIIEKNIKIEVKKGKIFLGILTLTVVQSKF